MGFFSDFISDPIGTTGKVGQKIIDNPIPAATAYLTQNPTALLSYAAPRPTASAGSGGSMSDVLNNAFLPLLQSTLGQEASKAQIEASRRAVQAAQQQAIQGGQTAANMAAFRPVGTTTRFGTSNFQFDPTTGQLTAAGYTPSALATGYQDALAKLTNQGLTQVQAQQELAAQYLASQQGQPVSALGSQLMASQAGQPLTSLGQQYLGESPEAIRQRYVEQQTALLAPQQEQALAGIRNRLFQTGRGGLATGATEAGGLAATNPEMAAYYNSLANQQRQIAAGADTAAQQQAQFGAGLLSQGTGLTQGQQLAGAGLYGTGLGLTQQGQQFGQQLGSTAFNPFTAGFAAQNAIEQAAQQPLTISSDLAKLQASAGGMQGQLYGQGAQRAASYGILPELQRSSSAAILSGLASPTSGLSGLFNGLNYNLSSGLNPLTGNAYDWTTGASVIPDSTFSGYGDVSDLAQYGVF